MKTNEEKIMNCDHKNIPTTTLNNEEVYKILLSIPEGKVSTYGDLAKALGNPSAARQIGRILNKNPNPIRVPCHRIVMSNGKLGGYSLGISKKKELLQKEGVILIEENKVHNFSKVRYYPQDNNKNSKAIRQL